MAPPILIPVYEYSANHDIDGKTVQTFLYSNLPNVEGDWEPKGFAFNTFEKDYPGVVPVFRYQAKDPVYRYQYTSKLSPGFDSGWVKDGTAFYAFETPHSGTVPLYRYSATPHQREQYSKKDNLGVAPWAYEGKAFYVLP